MGSINRDNNDVENGSSFDASAPATFGGVDWSTLLIEEEETDDYIVHVQEDTMYNLLGLEEEDQTVKVLRQAADDANAALVHANISVIDATDIEGAALPVDDLAPVEHFTFFDRDNPQMAVGDTFPSMDNFRMALKHYAIKREFDIKIIMSQPKKYMAYCKKFEDGCPFKITAKKKQEGTTVVVTEFEDKHMCASSSRKKTSMASQSWVAERAEIIMKNDPDMSAIDLQKKLQSDYNVKVPYHTVYKGRQRAIVDLYGSWEESFRLLYNFKAEIELRSPGSVVEIATKEAEGKTFFDKFFIAFKPCIDGFLSGCRPYCYHQNLAKSKTWAVIEMGLKDIHVESL